jgi:DNA-directed RNA polymerase subunit RPC12/RpoP
VPERKSKRTLLYRNEYLDAYRISHGMESLKDFGKYLIKEVRKNPFRFIEERRYLFISSVSIVASLTSALSLFDPTTHTLTQEIVILFFFSFFFILAIWSFRKQIKEDNEAFGFEYPKPQIPKSLPSLPKPQQQEKPKRVWCPHCSSENLIFQKGVFYCIDCGRKFTYQDFEKEKQKAVKEASMTWA